MGIKQCCSSSINEKNQTQNLENNVTIGEMLTKEIIMTANNLNINFNKHNNPVIYHLQKLNKNVKEINPIFAQQIISIQRKVRLFIYRLNIRSKLRIFSQGYFNLKFLEGKTIDKAECDRIIFNLIEIEKDLKNIAKSPGKSTKNYTKFLLDNLGEFVINKTKKKSNRKFKTSIYDSIGSDILSKNYSIYFNQNDGKIDSKKRQNLLYIGSVNPFWEFHGVGKLYFSNGDLYEGQFYKNLFHGEGRLITNSGECFEGGFKNGQVEGNAKMIDVFGNYFLGNFKGGKKHGQGEQKDALGNIFIGVFVENEKYKGVLNLISQKKIIDGIFYKAEKIGTRNFEKFGRSAKSEINFIEEKIVEQGCGKIFDLELETFFYGHWKDYLYVTGVLKDMKDLKENKKSAYFAGLPKEKGEFNINSFDSHKEYYYGEFGSNNIIEGFGVYYWSNARYEGNWKNNKQHGYGCIFKVNLKYRKYGYWNNGVLSYWIKEYTNDYIEAEKFVTLRLKLFLLQVKSGEECILDNEFEK